jgi:hypothetical protein
MPKIDTSGWGEFRLGKLLNLKNGETKGTGIFNIVNSVAYHGKDIEETNEDAPDTINYVTRSKFNNGVKCKVLKKESYIVNPAGTISFGAENADFFYQTEEYITGNKMYYIDTSALSKYSCAFLKSVLEATFTANFSFSDGMTPARIYDAVIKLPIDSKGNPDWQYMEDYMRNIEVRVSDSISKLESAKDIESSKIDVSSWGEFRIGDLFTQERGKESSPNRVEDGTLPMVNEINTNNGIAKFGKSSNVILGNCITVSVNYATNVFYQKNDFCASVNILVIRNTNMNEYSGKFIAGILSRNNLKYDYTNKISKDRLNDEFIKLPVDSKGNPDWQYMEDYMRNIEVRVSDSISKLESVLYSSEVSDLENSVSVILKGGE